jgi:hypothetical protein
MADDIDISFERQAVMEMAHLANCKKPEPEKTGTGVCWNCGAQLFGIMRWCNAECRDGWQAEQDFRSRNIGKSRH